MEQSAHNALVLWTFLQADSGNPQYFEELKSLGKDISRSRRWDVCSQASAEVESDGYLESDGHLQSNISLCVGGIAPIVDVPVNPEEAATAQRIAAELREIGDQFENDMVANAAQRLIRNLRTSSTDCWRDFLRQEVEIMQRQMSLQHLHQERLVAAVTFTLVKRVCEQVPALLRGLFNSALQYTNAGNTR